jgi:hypothetical protein
LYERPSETDLFDFLGAYVVFGDMRNPVFWPHQLMDFHVLSVYQCKYRDKENV